MGGAAVTAFLLDVVTATLVVTGAVFLLIAGIGVLRLPDVYLRMSCTSKAATLGVGCLLLAVALAAPDTAIRARALAGFLFLLLTAPVGGHMIGRAAYRLGVPLCDATVTDEFAAPEAARRERSRHSG